MSTAVYTTSLSITPRIALLGINNYASRLLFEDHLQTLFAATWQNEVFNKCLHPKTFSG